MKLIISYGGGKTEIFSISNIDSISFGVDTMTFEFYIGDSFFIKYSEIRSIVIA